MAELRQPEFHDQNLIQSSEEMNQEVVLYEQPMNHLKKITKMEKMILVLLVLFLVGVSSLAIQLSNNISKYEEQVAEVQSDSSNIQESIKELKQEKTELSKVDRIKQAAEKEGLEINEANIRNVTK